MVGYRTGAACLADFEGDLHLSLLCWLASSAARPGSANLVNEGMPGADLRRRTSVQPLAAGVGPLRGISHYGAKTVGLGYEASLEVLR